MATELPGEPISSHAGVAGEMQRLTEQLADGAHPKDTQAVFAPNRMVFVAAAGSEDSVSILQIPRNGRGSKWIPAEDGQLVEGLFIGYRLHVWPSRTLDRPDLDTTAKLSGVQYSPGGELPFRVGARLHIARAALFSGVHVLRHAELARNIARLHPLCRPARVAKG